MHLAGYGIATATPVRPENVNEYGLADSDFELLNQLAFAAALRGRKAETNSIADAIEKIAPEHVAPVIARSLLLMSTNDRRGGLDLLYKVGMRKSRRWEEAAVLLLQFLDPKTEAAKVAEIRRVLGKSERRSELMQGVDK